jgi:hypothetical protein
LQGLFSLPAGHLWKLQHILSPAMPANTILAGAFRRSTILFERQMLTVEIAFENEDDFVKNLCTLRGEERVALAIPIPAGLAKSSLTAP